MPASGSDPVRRFCCTWKLVIAIIAWRPPSGSDPVSRFESMPREPCPVRAPRAPTKKKTGKY
eukprot:1500896-Amphidinium_carterae.1